MAVALVDGHARLTVEGRDLGPAVLQRLEIEWPEVTSLPSVPGGNGIRKRRGLLRAASLFVAGDRLRGRLEAATLPTGIERLGLALASGGIALSGHVVSGGQAADFTARLVLTAGQGRALRVGVADVTVDGPPPLPLETIAAGALAALRSLHAPRADGTEHAEGSALEVDVLEPALDETLVAAGWRLPDGTDLRWCGSPSRPRG